MFEYIPLFCMTGSKGWLQSLLYKTKYSIHAKTIKEIYLSGITKVFSSPYYHTDELWHRFLERGPQSHFLHSPIEKNGEKKKDLW